jgi:hypothetical protein
LAIDAHQAQPERGDAADHRPAELSGSKPNGYDHRTRTTDKYYLANGEVGLVATAKSSWMNVAFASREHIHVSFKAVSANATRLDLELAYAPTVHKAQGSEFGTASLHGRDQRGRVVRVGSAEGQGVLERAPGLPGRLGGGELGHGFVGVLLEAGLRRSALGGRERPHGACHRGR